MTTTRTPSTSSSTTSGTDLTAATSYGFACDAQWGWVRQNWPDVSVRSAANTEVRVHALLYRWDGGASPRKSSIAIR